MASGSCDHLQRLIFVPSIPFASCAHSIESGWRALLQRLHQDSTKIPRCLRRVAGADKHTYAARLQATTERPACLPSLHPTSDLSPWSCAAPMSAASRCSPIIETSFRVVGERQRHPSSASPLSVPLPRASDPPPGLDSLVPAAPCLASRS